MFGIGFGELILVIIVAVCVLDTQQLPVFARKLGRIIASIRRVINEFNTEFDSKLNQSAFDKYQDNHTNEPAGNRMDNSNKETKD